MKAAPKETEDPVDKIIVSFDFDRVQKHMTATDWKWAGAAAENRIPSIAELRKTARELLLYVRPGRRCEWIGSGGFIAIRHQGRLGLYFCVTATTEADFLP